MYFVYLVRCADNSLYCGQTRDLNERIKEHNGEKNKGAKYTRSRRPVVLVYKEIADTLSNALKREAEVKRMPKHKKELLVTFKYPLNNPHFD